MKYKLIALTIAVVSFAGATAASAQPERGAYGVRDGNSYRCYTDEGYGRYLPCDLGGGS